MRHDLRTLLVPLLVGVSSALVSLASSAELLPGDLNGDGNVDLLDEALLQTLYGTKAGETGYDAGADVDGDGVIDLRDLALFGFSHGSTGGETDGAPPGLVVTLNDIPDNMNDLLVVPPDLFQVTILTDSFGGSVIDVNSLQVTASEPFGPFPPGTDLGGQFSATPTRFFWEVPAGSDLDRTSHYLTVSVSDTAGNVAQEVYGFAVRGFPFGPQLENPQLVFLDFDQDRSLGPEIDFIEDLREYGLSSPALDPMLEAEIRDGIVAYILSRTHEFFGFDASGTPGPDAVDVQFVSVQPGSSHARICVGGQSSQGGPVLGSVKLDLHNVNEFPQECGGGGNNGVFPAAIDNLWGSDPDYLVTFGPVDPDLGGIPFGEHPEDAAIMAPDFDFQTATSAQVMRLFRVVIAMDAFARTMAAAIAHEVGHTFGLTAPGPAPGGLFGGTYGGQQDHNVNAFGSGTPAANLVMNRGGSFSFAEVSGRSGNTPVFRPLNWAYLRNRVVLSPQVTGLFPKPQVTSVSPNPAMYPDPYTSISITIHGMDFLGSPATPLVDLITEGDPTPNSVMNVMFVDPQTLTGLINPFVVPPALYDVRVSNPDGQVTVLEDAVLVQ